MKKFFSIKSNNYQFEIMDIITLLTILNVGFIICGFWYAPIFGLCACVLSIVTMIKNKNHINNYVMQLALIILNIFFLI